MGRGAVAEIAQLDPDAVVVKGDLTDRGLPEQYEAFLATFGVLGPRMRHVRGNHDAMTDPTLAVEGAPYAVELPGVTLAVLDTTAPGHVGGALSGRAGRVARRSRGLGELPRCSCSATTRCGTSTARARSIPTT